MMANRVYRLFGNLVAVILLLFTFVLPFKFGGIIGVPEASDLFPSKVFSWVIISWPIFLFPLFAGVILLLSLLAFPPEKLAFKNDKMLTITSLWVLLAFASLPGIINALVWDFVIMQLTHLFGLAAYVISLYLFIKRVPRARNLLTAAIFAGLAVSVYCALRQYFTGFEAMREFISQERFAAINDAIKARIMDNRIYSPFVGSNSLAGYLLLTGPLALVTVWNADKYTSLPKNARLVLVPLAAACLLFIFFESKARGAFLALILACGVFIVVFPVKKWLRILVIISAPLAVVGGTWYIYKYGRGFDSINARIDYIRVSFELLFKHPFFGTGWGDFFYDYMRLKTIISKEAPHTPHNLLLAFGGQAGILAMLTAVGVLFYPLVTTFSKVRKLVAEHCYMNEKTALFFGFTTFVFHSMMDIDLQVPGVIGPAALFTLLLVMPSENPELAEKSVSGIGCRLGAYLLIIVVGASAVIGGWHLNKSKYMFAQLCNLCRPIGKTRKQVFGTSSYEVNERLEAAVKVSPYSPFPYGVAGSFYMMVHNFTDAESCYRKALSLMPDSAAYNFRLSCILKAKGEIEEAKKYLCRAYELFPYEPNYRAAYDAVIRKKR